MRPVAMGDATAPRTWHTWLLHSRVVLVTTSPDIPPITGAEILVLGPDGAEMTLLAVSPRGSSPRCWLCREDTGELPDLPLALLAVLAMHASHPGCAWVPKSVQIPEPSVSHSCN